MFAAIFFGLAISMQMYINDVCAHIGIYLLDIRIQISGLFSDNGPFFGGLIEDSSNAILTEITICSCRFVASEPILAPQLPTSVIFSLPRMSTV